MRILIVIIIIAFSSVGFANMASPYRFGTKVSNAFTSSEVDILKERINVTLNKESSTANYVVEYFIRTDKEGKQIPLMFYASEYKGDFKVWVDGKKVSLQKIPNDYTRNKFEGFSKSYNNKDVDKAEVAIRWRDNSSIIYKLTELKYFEVDLAKGEHTIRVEYASNVWEDRSKWVKEFSYRYSLSPARYWKSFGTLEITLDARGFGEELNTNLGKQESGKQDSAVWKFDKLPADVFEISYVPKISPTANLLINIEPSGLAMIIGLLLWIIHLFLTWRYRRSNPGKRFSWVMILGSLIVPAIILFYYVYSFDIIDSAIGDYASMYHGYNFLVVFIYPVLMPVYLIVMWISDRMMKNRLVKNFEIKD